MAKFAYIYSPRPPYAHPKLSAGGKYLGGRDKEEGALAMPDGSEVRVPLKHLAIDRVVPAEDLKSAATHVAHEMRSTGQAFNHHSNRFAYTSWFVHCRNLMIFFAGNAGNDDDVYAQDYFDEADRLSWLSEVAAIPEPADYDRYYVGANKLAAHLTYSRAKDPSLLKIVPSRVITEHLSGCALLFLRRLRPERTAWFGGLML